MLRMLLTLTLSFIFWATVSGVIDLILHLIGVIANFWCVYSFVLIGTIVYFYLTHPPVCPVKIKKGPKLMSTNNYR